MIATYHQLLLGFALLAGLPSTGAHIRLTFPPARYPSLDFLDSARTTPPCGAPKPDPNTGKFTSLKSGSSFNVTWFQSYAHKGGFRIELLNDKDALVQVLTPDKPQFVQANDETTETYQVKLPDQFQCDNCAIRLVRQASEWGDYLFWSCADVSITKNPTDVCSGNGRLSGENCVCDRLYSGPECQYKDECWEDKDCGLNGSCQEPYGSTSSPKRICYCKLGYFGPQCSKTSTLRKKQFDPDLYQLKTVGSDWNKIYWRILDESSEIEVVLQYPTTSWVALGWRPNDLDNQCQKRIFQKIGKSPELEPTVAVTAESTVHGGVEADTHHHTVAEPEPSQVVPEPTRTNVTSTLNKFNTSATLNLTSKQDLLTTEPFPTANQTANRTVFTPNLSIVRPTPTVADVVQNLTEGETETTDEITKATTTGGRPKSGGLSVVPPSGVTRPNVPAVVGTQVVLVEAPQVDIVTQKTKRPDTASSIDQSNIDFNEKPGKPTQFVGKNNSKTPDVSYVEGESCFGEWRWPPECMDTKFPPPGHKTCDYRISWSLSEDSDDVEWSIETRGPTNWWTGLGFSKTGSMTDADMVIVTSETGGEIKVRDGYSTGYAAPAFDAEQNVKFQGGTHVNGVLRVGFTRPRKTGDSAHDVQFTDTDCFYLLFPVTGGRVTNGQISQHLDTPKNSSVPVCIRHCSNKLPAAPKTCVTEHKYPPGCTLPDCDYRAKWHYNPASEDVTFEITAKEMGRWTGIGFSRDGNMTNSDMVIGWMYEDAAYVTDRYAYGKHQPAIDSLQNLAGISGKAVNGYQTISFRRKLVTDDKKEDLPLNECLYFLYPVGGGRVLARTSQEFSDKTTAIGYHDLYIPHISKDPICICTEGDVGNSSRIRRQAAQAQPAVTLSTANLIKSEHSGYMWETSQNFSVIRNLSHVAELISHQLQATINNGSIPPVPEPELPPNGPVVESSNSSQSGKSRPIPEGEPNPEGEPRGDNKAPNVEPHSERPKNALSNPMDCTDIVIGSAIGDMSRIGDYYTVSRATPRQDSFYGGEDSLSAAVGWEENGVTTVMFRKPLKASDAADHPIINGYMQVIWAKGQETRNQFYPTDVVKYHGRNRGALQINFMDKGKSTASQCLKQFSYPANCEPSQCSYSATWFRNNSDINFSLTAKMKPNSYTGIGWSAKGTMENADMIIIKVNEKSEVEITDRFSKGYSVPENDKEQDIFNINAHYSNGVVTAAFSRPLITADTTQDLNLDTCQYFLYIHTAGPIGSDGQIAKHLETPVKSTEQICMTKCDAVQKTKEKPTADTAIGAVPEEAPKPSSYYIQVYMPDAKWSDDLKDPNSAAYQTFTKQLIDELTKKVSPKLAGFKKFKVIEYISGSVYARLELIADGHSSQEIQQVLQQELSQDSNTPGSLKIDPQSVQVSKVHDRSASDLTRNYIIIGVCCGVVLISILFGVVLCIIMRNKRSRSLKMNLTPKNFSVPFAPYSYLVQNGSYAQYPSSAYQQFTLPTGMSPEKTGSPGGNSSPGQTATTPNQTSEGFGYSSEVYHNAKVGTTNGHNRQYSSATTATVANGKKGGKGTSESGKAEGKETSLNEWYQRVGQTEESQTEAKNLAGPPLPPAPFGYGGRPDGPFVAYPNDPYGYYTAQNRMYAARGAVPPTNFYRPY